MTNTNRRCRVNSPTLKQRKSPTRQCVSCLYRIGFGSKRIGRLILRNHSLVLKWVKQEGLFIAGRDGVETWKRLSAYRNRDKVVTPQIAKPRPLTSEEKAQRSRDSSKAYYHANKRAIYNRTKANPSKIIKMRLARRLWKFARNGHKIDSMRAIVGCSFEFLKEWIEARFLPGMCWSNYGEWHFDHIIPCASFDLTNPNEQKKCFHYSNIQPLWAGDNLRKSAKITTGTQPELSMAI
jgi:hypothetical protein